MPFETEDPLTLTGNIGVPIIIEQQVRDRAERHDFKPRLWLYFPLFSSLLKKEGRRKIE